MTNFNLRGLIQNPKTLQRKPLTLPFPTKAHDILTYKLYSTNGVSSGVVLAHKTTSVMLSLVMTFKLLNKLNYRKLKKNTLKNSK